MKKFITKWKAWIYPIGIIAASLTAVITLVKVTGLEAMRPVALYEHDADIESVREELVQVVSALNEVIKIPIGYEVARLERLVFDSERRMASRRANDITVTFEQQKELNILKNELERLKSISQ